MHALSVGESEEHHGRSADGAQSGAVMRSDKLSPDLGRFVLEPVINTYTVSGATSVACTGFSNLSFQFSPLVEPCQVLGSVTG